MSLSFSSTKSREFCRAAGHGDLELVQSLSVDPEVNLNWQDADGWTPFCWACYYVHVDVIRYLLDFHDNHPREPIDFDLVTKWGGSPLWIVCRSGYEKVVEMLLEDDRIDVNRVDMDKQTPLWIASWNGQLGIVKRLLASTREIDVLKKDKYEKKTAAEIARKEREDDIAALIESYEKDPEGVTKRLRRELGLDVRLAGELFALVVYHSDGHLKLHSGNQGGGQRFFSIASRLPMELQMVLCNQAFGVAEPIIKRSHSEKGFKKFAKGM